MIVLDTHFGVSYFNPTYKATNEWDRSKE